MIRNKNQIEIYVSVINTSTHISESYLRMSPISFHLVKTKINEYSNFAN